MRTFVIIEAPRPSIATAPRGKGWVMMPTMVPRKMARRCHACTVTPAGGGRNHTVVATATQMPRFFMSAPHLKGGSAGADGDVLTAALALADTERAVRPDAELLLADTANAFWLLPAFKAKYLACSADACVETLETERLVLLQLLAGTTCVRPGADAEIAPRDVMIALQRIGNLSDCKSER